MFKLEGFESAVRRSFRPDWGRGSIRLLRLCSCDLDDCLAEVLLKEFLKLSGIVIFAESRFERAAVGQVGKPALDELLQAIPLAFALFENFLRLCRN
jgi:hypothetical protein